MEESKVTRMKVLILCLLTARTCLGKPEQVLIEKYNDTITEFLEKYPTITIANDEELAIASKNLAANEAQINAQNEAYANGTASYRQNISIPEQKMFNLQHSLYTFFLLVAKLKLYLIKKSVFLAFFERIRAFSQLDNTNNLYNITI